MKNELPSINPLPTRRGLPVLAAWLVLLLVSDLTSIIIRSAGLRDPGWLFTAKLVFLAFFMGLTLAWERLKPLFHFGFIMLVFYLSLGLSSLLGGATFWKDLFGGTDPSFTLGYLNFHIRDLAVAGLVIAGLFMVKKKRQTFFLVKGKLDAPVEPVPWLGIRQGESWKSFGWIFGGVAALVVLILVLLSVKPSLEIVGRALPYLPLALLLSAANAFAEEVYYRLAILSTLYQVIGKTQAMLAASVFFGLAHYLYGSPPGMIGFLMTGFLGWLMAKSILETRGLLWAWMIHLLADFFIFFSYALAWVSR